MPVFDYECKNCGKRFEELVTSSSTPDSEIKCPGCGEHQSVRRMSAPAIGSSGTSSGNRCGSAGFT